MNARPSLRQLRAADHDNVTILPTAAPRRVSNGRYAEQRRASLAARNASPFAKGYRSGQDREADKLAADLIGIKQTPELLILSAMLRAMDAGSVDRLLGHLAPGLVIGSGLARQAVATIRSSRLNVGQQQGLFRALDRLRGEG